LLSPWGSGRGPGPCSRLMFILPAGLYYAGLYVVRFRNATPDRQAGAVSANSAAVAAAAGKPVPAGRDGPVRIGALPPRLIARQPNLAERRSSKLRYSLPRSSSHATHNLLGCNALLLRDGTAGEGCRKHGDRKQERPPSMISSCVYAEGNPTDIPRCGVSVIELAPVRWGVQAPERGGAVEGRSSGKEDHRT
jgi:hypothetical protein